MTLDEAIKHAEEVAEKNEKIAFDLATAFNRETINSKECKKCAEEHRQLTEWLKELKQLREQDCKNKKYGKWIEIYAKNYELPRLYKCSKCEMTEMEYPSSIYEHFRYCPNCGKRMKCGDSEEQ